MTFSSPQHLRWQVILAVMTLLVPVITIVIDVKDKVKEIKEMTEELDSELAKNLVEDDDTRLGRKKKKKD